MVVSDYAVQAKPGAVTQLPMFPEDDVLTTWMLTRARRQREKCRRARRQVRTIGNPVVAEAKDGDVLTYTLGRRRHALSFAIDSATGQI